MYSSDDATQESILQTSTDSVEKKNSERLSLVDIQLDKDISASYPQQSHFVSQTLCKICEKLEKIILTQSDEEYIDRLDAEHCDPPIDIYKPGMAFGEHIKQEEYLIKPVQFGEQQSLETGPGKERTVTKAKPPKKEHPNEDRIKDEIIEAEPSAHFLEVNHMITESHQLLHVKTIIGVLQSIIGVILFAMKGSIVFDLNDAEVWRGFANRCEELNSQLEILTESFLEKKMEAKLKKKKKRQDRFFGLMKFLEEKPTRSKLRRLPKAMKNLLECERQVGLIKGEIIFIRDITLISESLKGLFLYMEAELVRRKDTGPKYRAIKGGKTEGRTTRRRGKQKQVTNGADMESTEKKENPRDENSSEKREKSQEGNVTEKKSPEGKSTDGASGSGQKGASKKSADTTDPVFKAAQGKVEELGDQLGGQVKQVGDQVIKGLFQKAKDMTNLI